MTAPKPDQPYPQDMYCSELERDACGIGMIVNINNTPSHDLVERSIGMLINTSHRGATGYEESTGDGAGILTQIPHELFDVTTGFTLPSERSYGVGMLFFPKGDKAIQLCKNSIESCAEELGFQILGYRVVATDNSLLGRGALEAEPHIEQVFVSPVDGEINDLERRLYVFRHFIKRRIYQKFNQWRDDFYIVSFSSRTIVYKGQLTPKQLNHYYRDLTNEKFKSALALVHSRFSTNTVPRWKMAQPFRSIAHNGEINTIKGNLNWWKAREAEMLSHHFTTDELEVILPLCNMGISDSGNFDHIFEFLKHNAIPACQAMMMMIPEAWQEDEQFDRAKKAFYQYHDNIIEPWDGPASICFTDGAIVGATVDRNGLRPSRYTITKYNEFVLASETGCVDIPESSIKHKGQLAPGQIVAVDLDAQKVLFDDEIKRSICNGRDYHTLIEHGIVDIQTIEVPTVEMGHWNPSMNKIEERLSYFGITKEDYEIIANSMTAKGKEPIGSMGRDIPLAVLSRFPQHVGNYFKQEFAQVTNPPIDPIRERDVMSLRCVLGSRFHLFGENSPKQPVLSLASPILNTASFAKCLKFFGHGTYEIDLGFMNEHDQSLQGVIEEISAKAVQAVQEGYSAIVLTHRNLSSPLIPVPSLLAVGAIHHQLIYQGLRLRVVLIADAADCWETHHFATLLGFGVDAVYPRMAIEVANTHMGAMGVSHYLRAADLGLLKIMSKLGVSTITSYKGAQTFEALGICQDVIDICFKGTISRIGGMTFSALQKECVQRIQVPDCNGHKPLPNLGNFKWRPNGEYHHFNPNSIHLLQHSTRTGDYALFKKYTDEINRVDKHFCTLRSLLDFKGHKPIPLEQVEDEEYILRRFATGAMSFGSLSYEAHTSLAIAMNRIGAKSNSGEGGEDPARYMVNANGDSLRSSIKQVASGRFGVTIEYLNEADELQIKMAQGAKPGEGGQLPGHKVDSWIARVRHSTPGVGLISPPPHHDIYSIEDLAQLIYDLKNANRDARISVKLVSKAGVGIIASGVAKGKAEHILISGNDGGTGASPLSSITHAGLPWELGLAETHQTLVRNKLRDRVTLQCDGQIRTGRDLAIATLLGAEEWGIATAALVVQGCILMRKCHLNTCPVGIATQDERLRDKFNGRVEDIINYFKFLARDLREIMAGLGFRTIDEMVGRADALKQIEVKDHPKATLIDLSRLLHYKTSSPDIGTTNSRSQNHGLDLALDRRLIAKSSSALNSGTPVQFSINIRNTHRAVGTMLSSMVYRRFGRLGLPDDTITIDLQGSAGQSFGSFLSRGITMRLEGDANDYVGKGLSGGKLIIRPNRASRITASHNAIIGNVALYGATSGEVYIAGQAGQRFAVRNSGATVVVEGVGNNGCEYMTGGIIVNLGEMGSNFAAGMSGGIAFQYGRNVMVSLAGKTQIQFERLNSHDRETLRALLLKHLEYTSSDLAKSILKNWNSSVRSFVKIIPHEYKKIIHSESKVNHIANALNF